MMNWPSREKWARDRRIPYYDRFDDVRVSSRLSAYATPEEIEQAVRDLKALRLDLHRRMKLPSISAHDRETFRMKRKGISRTLKNIIGDKDEVVDAPLELRYGAEEILAPFDERYMVAHEAAEETRRIEIENTPIDDEAWERELRWRERIDREKSNPEAFIHRPK